MPKVSVILPSYNRCHQARQTLKSIFDQGYEDLEVILVDDGSTDDTPKLAAEFPIRYFRLERDGWRNPSYPLNVGIRQATGEIAIIGGAEVRHEGPQTIARFVEALERDPRAWVFATVRAQTYPDVMGDLTVYVSPRVRKPYWFLCALMRHHLVDIGGMDEDYTQAGYDDNDIADRLTRGVGLEPKFRGDIHGLHLWHEPSPFKREGTAMRQLYEQKTADWRSGKITHVRNIGREWGKLPT